MHPEELTTQYLDIISRKVAWLDEQWSVPEGDVNCDGYITSADVTTIYNYLLLGDESFLFTCDIDGDGEVTAHDITSLYNIILDQFPPLPH